MEFPHLVLLGLSWLAPTLALTGLILLRWRLARRRLNLRLGWWGSTATLLICGFVTQWGVVWCWGWPDGSMAGYGVLLAILALAQTLLVRQE